MLYRTRDKYTWLKMQTIYPFAEEGVSQAVKDAMTMKTVKSTNRAVAGAGGIGLVVAS